MATQKILIATHNKHKISEISPFFANTAWEPILDIEIGFTVPEVDETGATFAENALLKAKAFSRASSYPVVADDSGLEVAALDNQPGVHSNRWHPGTYADRNEALLERMKDSVDRSARFVTVACLLFPNEQPQYFSGVVTGVIAYKPLGTQGFGYDPLFIPDGYSKSFAELGAKAKSQLSHRARAFTQVVAALQTRK